MRRIRSGEVYTAEEPGIELEEVEPNPEPPPEEMRGEPWGWTKPGPKPRGWRRDGKYDGS